MAATWMALGLAVVVAAADFATVAPLGAAGAYQLSLLSRIGTAGLTVLLLAVLLRWPAQRRVADALLLFGAALLALGIVYQVVFAVLDALINAGKPPFALPTGPFADPVLETGAGAIGVWFLALGVGRLNRSSSPTKSMVGQVVVLAAGLVAATLIVTSTTLPGWAPEYRVAVLATAFGALGWAALGRAILVGHVHPAGRWLVFLGALVTLLRVGLNAQVLLTTHGAPGPLGADDAGLLGTVLGLLASVSLCAGFALVAGGSLSLPVPFTSKSETEDRPIRL